MDNTKNVDTKPTKVNLLLPPKKPKAPKLDQQVPKHFRNYPLTLKQLRTHQMDTAKWTSKLTMAKTGGPPLPVPYQTMAPPQTKETTAYQATTKNTAKAP